MTGSIWKIVKLDWKTSGILFVQTSGNPVVDCCICVSFLSFSFLRGDCAHGGWYDSPQFMMKPSC